MSSSGLEGSGRSALRDRVDVRARAAVRGWSTTERRDRIYLLLVYSKGVKDDLSRAEENELRRLGRALEGEE